MAFNPRSTVDVYRRLWAGQPPQLPAVLVASDLGFLEAARSTFNSGVAGPAAIGALVLQIGNVVPGFEEGLYEVTFNWAWFAGAAADQVQVFSIELRDNKNLPQWVGYQAIVGGQVARYSRRLAVRSGQAFASSNQIATASALSQWAGSITVDPILT